MNMNLHKAIRPAPRPHGDMYTGPNVRGSRQELIVRPSELSIGTDGTYGEQPSSPKSGAISTDVADCESDVFTIRKLSNFGGPSRVRTQMLTLSSMGF